MPDKYSSHPSSRKFLLQLIEIVIEIHNWSKFREQRIVGCPAPVDRSKIQSIPKAQGTMRVTGYEVCKKQRTRVSAVGYRMLEKLDPGNLNKVVTQTRPEK